MVARQFRIPAFPSHRYPYELATLDDLHRLERVRDALAHLVVYERPRRQGPEFLYRICLQDDLILERSAGGELSSLLVYIITHELVHVVRFQRAEESFLAGRASREQEEEQVHRITLGLLEESGESRISRPQGDPARKLK